MPRKGPKGGLPEPWWRERLGAWYVTIGGKQRRLGKDRAEAFALWHRLMAEAAEAKGSVESKAPSPSGRSDRSPLVGAAIAEFLASCRDPGSGLAPRTADWYKQRLAGLEACVGASFPLPSLRGYHIERWLRNRTGLGPSSRRGSQLCQHG